MSRSMLKLRQRPLREREATRLFRWAQARDNREWLPAQPSRHACDLASLICVNALQSMAFNHPSAAPSSTTCSFAERRRSIRCPLPRTAPGPVDGCRSPGHESAASDQRVTCHDRVPKCCPAALPMRPGARRRQRSCAELRLPLRLLLRGLPGVCAFPRAS
jgi:hypothetical protein